MFRSLLWFFLRFFSRAIIRKYHPDVIGVTGSVGKTSAKEAISLVLASKFTVRASYKNQNNQVGIPLAIIGINASPGRWLGGWAKVFGRALRLLIKQDSQYPAMLVLEMGADRPGDLDYLIDIAPCKVAVLTSITHAHTEFFKTLKKIAQEKRVIIARLRRDGFAVLNFDSELVMENAAVTKAEKITYGLKSGADLQATDARLMANGENGWPAGITFKINYKGNSVPVFLPEALGSTAIPAALAALAVGVIYGINLVEAAAALRTLLPLPGHLRSLSGIKHTLIIDDTYNSNPMATEAALRTLAQIKIGSRAERYAVLGDMLELGAETESAHRAIGFKVAELGVDFLITVGEASKGTAAAACEAGLLENRIASFADSVSAGKFLQEKLSAGDVVLVKGSQGARMERIVKEIMAEPLAAPQLLVRQTKEWV